MSVAESWPRELPRRPGVSILRRMKSHRAAIFPLQLDAADSAALEAVRAQAETDYWQQMALAKPAADLAATLPTAKERRAAMAAIERQVGENLKRSGLSERIYAGIAADVAASTSSYVELVGGGHNASWPEQRKPEAIKSYAERLDDFAAAIDEETERAARNALMREPRPIKPRPLTLVRRRDCRIIRDRAGRLHAAFDLLKETDPRSRYRAAPTGHDASTGQDFDGAAKYGLVVGQIRCGIWHENTFLVDRLTRQQRAALKSCKLVREGQQWFMHAQFEYVAEDIKLSGAAVGVDRGVVAPAGISVVSETGEVIAQPGRRGQEIADKITSAFDRRRKEQRRRGKSSTRHTGTVKQSLHILANEIVDIAVEHRAEVVVEKLDNLKRAIVTKRKKGSRRAGWHTVLKKAQFGNLERIIDYKLRGRGLRMREVFAAGTSQTCAACGLRDARNRDRRQQAVFLCVGCAHEANADDNASIVIGRRGIIMRDIRKGGKLHDLHRDMVGRLRSDDHCGGLGRLGGSVRSVVAVRDSGPVRLKPRPSGRGSQSGPRLVAITESKSCPQNRQMELFEPGRQPDFPSRKPRNPKQNQGVAPHQVRLPGF